MIFVISGTEGALLRLEQKAWSKKRDNTFQHVAYRTRALKKSRYPKRRERLFCKLALSKSYHLRHVQRGRGRIVARSEIIIRARRRFVPFDNDTRYVINYRNHLFSGPEPRNYTGPSDRSMTKNFSPFVSDTCNLK